MDEPQCSLTMGRSLEENSDSKLHGIHEHDLGLWGRSLGCPLPAGSSQVSADHLLLNTAPLLQLSVGAEQTCSELPVLMWMCSTLKVLLLVSFLFLKVVSQGLNAGLGTPLRAPVPLLLGAQGKGYFLRRLRLPISTSPLIKAVLESLRLEKTSEIT